MRPSVKLNNPKQPRNCGVKFGSLNKFSVLATTRYHCLRGYFAVKRGNEFDVRFAGNKSNKKELHDPRMARAMVSVYRTN